MKIIKLDEVDSTNTYLKNLQDKNDYDTVIALSQTQGRGRRGNTWISQNGMALFSFCIEENNISQEDYIKVPLMAGIAVLRGLYCVEKLDYKFKWTNDIYLEDKKISGILVEKICNYFIIGIGINVNNIDFGNISDIATSLRNTTQKYYNIDDIILTVINEFKNVIKLEWSEILSEINNKNYLLNKEIEVVKMGENIGRGIARNISQDGSLEVLINNKIENYYIGEIHIKR